MAEDVIDILVDRAKIQEDIDFLTKEAQRALDIIKAMKLAYVEISKASNFDNLNANVKDFINLEKQAESAIKDYSKAVQQQKADLEQANKALNQVASSIDENIRMNLQHKAELKAVQKEMKDLQKAAEGTTNSMDDYSKNIQDLAKRELELKQAVSETTISLKSQIKEAQAAPGSYDAMNATLGQLRDSFRKLNAEDRNGDIGNSLLASINELDKELKDIDASIGNYQRNVGNYGGSFKQAFDVLKNELTEVTSKLNGMDSDAKGFAELKEQQELLLQVTTGLNKEYGTTKAELRSLEEAAQKLAGAWGQNNEKVQEFIQVVGGVKDDLGDVKESIKLASSDTKGFDNMIAAAQGIAGGFAVAEGATALFGGENEELQKTLTRLNAVMTILNGLQAIQNELKRKDSIFTALQTAATQTYTWATTGATVATKALRLAIAATGIGLLVVAIGFLVPKIMEWTNGTKDMTAAQDALNSAIERGKDLLQDDIDRLEYSSKARIANAKLAGASEKELAKIEKQVSDERIDNYKRNLDAAQQRVDELAKTEDKNLDMVQAANKELLAAGKAYDKAVLDASSSALDKQVKQKEDADKRVQDANKRAAEKNREFAQREYDAAFSLSQLKLQTLADTQKRISDDEKRDADERLLALYEYNKVTAQIIEAEKSHLLSNKKLTKSEREKIEFEAQIKLNDLARTGAAERATILDKELQALKDAQLQFETDEIAGRGNTQKTIISNTIAANAKFVRANSEAYTQDLLALEDGLKSKKLTNKQYQEQKEALDNKFNLTEINNQVALNEALIANLKQAGFDTKEFEQKLTELKRQQSDLRAKAVIDGNQKEIESDQKKLEKKRELNEKFKELANELLNLSQTLITAGYEREKNAIQENIDAITEKTVAEIAAVNASALSQQEKADKIAAINTTAQAKKEQLEARQREIDNKKAKAERLFQVFNIVGNTAMAVTKALPNLGLAALVGVIGAVQLATLLATPIPKYKEGTDYHQGGLAIVGDGGKKELGIKPSGEMFVTPSTPTLVDLPKGTKVYPDYEKYINNMQLSMLGQNLQQASNPISGNEFQNLQIKMLEAQLQANNNELVAVRKSIENLTIHSTELTENGFNYGIKKGMKKLKFIDNYFKS